MKTERLWQIAVTTSAEAEEPLAALLERVTGQSVVSFHNAQNGQVRLSAYCPSSFAWTPPLSRVWQAGRRRLAESGLRVGPARLHVGLIRERDWAQAWKRHFPPLLIQPWRSQWLRRTGANRPPGSRRLRSPVSLRILPPWQRRTERRGEVVVVLDPGLSFGTGHHPTTAFCLRQLLAHRIEGQAQSFLDLGTGSGVLAIAAAKLGYHPILAVDCDRQALRMARENAARNGVAGSIRFRQQNVLGLPPKATAKFDVVCANLEFNLLRSEAPRIAGQLARHGILVLAGILRGQFPQVQAAYRRCGLKLVASQACREWRSGGFGWA